MRAGTKAASDPPVKVHTVVDAVICRGDLAKFGIGAAVAVLGMHLDAVVVAAVVRFRALKGHPRNCWCAVEIHQDAFFNAIVVVKWHKSKLVVDLGIETIGYSFSCQFIYKDLNYLATICTYSSTYEAKK